MPLNGDVQRGDLCDDCHSAGHPWDFGRTALLYKERGRDLVLALKHADRLDLGPMMGKWLAQAVKDHVRQDTLLVPVPLHWTRLLKRRYNQSALLVEALAGETGCDFRLDLIKRRFATQSLDGLGRDDRFDHLKTAFDVPQRRASLIKGRPVVIVDDVMTTGATLSGCAKACLRAGCASVGIVTLARVAKDA